MVVAKQAELFDPNKTAYDIFGDNVALSGNTALILGCKASGNPVSPNVVYIYVRSGSSWTKQAEIPDPDPTGNDGFGWSLAVSGDTAIIGADATTVDGYANAGAAYVYVRSGTTWTKQAEITNPSPAASDNFGTVALEGNTALVGTFVSNSYTGEAYVYVRTGTSWTQQAQLVAADGAAGDDFGCAFALSGNTALVGAYGKNGGGENGCGAAYVFTRSGTHWTQQAELAASDGAYRQNFGQKVALSGNTALVGASYTGVDWPPPDGAAYVFTGSGTSWSQQAEFKDPAPGTSDSFGYAVDLAGNTAIVGAPTSASNTGSAYFFTRSGTSWAKTKLAASDAAAQDDFGIAVALSGNTCLVGASGKTVNGAFAAGAAYVYLLKAPAVVPSVTLKASPLSVKVGKSVTLSGAVLHRTALKTVLLYRKVGAKLALLKKVTCSSAGAYRWPMKATKIGKWVIEACYRVGSHSYCSKAVTVVVHK